MCAVPFSSALEGTQLSQLTIKFFEPSSTPSVLVDGAHTDHLLIQFIGGELRPLSACLEFVNQMRELSTDADFDFGFGNAVALSVKNGLALFEHVIADVPTYSLPLPLLLQIVECWFTALNTSAHKFTERTFDVP